MCFLSYYERNEDDQLCIMNLLIKMMLMQRRRQVSPRSLIPWETHLASLPHVHILTQVYFDTYIGSIEWHLLILHYQLEK